jgi:hypothetical protein
MAKYKIYYIEDGKDKTEEITSSKNIVELDQQLNNKQPSRIDILEDPDGINTDEALGYTR